MSEDQGRASWSHRLYTGETNIDFVGRQRLWYLISAALLGLALLALVLRPLNLGIEFTGGAEFTAEVDSVSVEDIADLRADLVATGIDSAAEARITVIGNPERVRVTTGELTTDQAVVVRDAIAASLGVAPEAITTQNVGPSWGAEISGKALRGLVAFLIAVVIYLSIAFEWRMAVAALAALTHDVVATIGIYALVGFDVTPATVIGLLTILGYSLYDTVVVFDKVRENTHGLTAQSRITYSEAANLAVNQTLVRSINTSVIALLPIGSILFVGAGLLGAGTLKDLALALFIGVAVGTYSSIFIATPLAADLKERQPEMIALRQRVLARRRAGLESAAGGTRTATGPAEGSAVTVGAASSSGAAVRSGRMVESGERQQRQKSTRSQRKRR